MLQQLRSSRVSGQVISETIQHLSRYMTCKLVYSNKTEIPCYIVCNLPCTAYSTRHVALKVYDLCVLYSLEHKLQRFELENRIEMRW